MRGTLDQLIDVKCCIRPLRAAGPNLAAEIIGNALVVHNYGHGGSGWSLSWGSAEVAVGKALSVLPREIAVVGCGIIGLTTAVVAQRAGLRVTIYARDMIQRSRSFRASGSFTPDSRVALTEPAGPAFGDLWETMARLSWKTFRTYLGLPGNPVEFHDSYGLSDTPIEKRHYPPDPAITDSYATKGVPVQNSEFMHLSDRIKDIVPQAVDVPAEENPFALPYAQRSSQMHFNFASYAHTLLSEFFAGGGRFVNRDFHSPAEYGQLAEKVVINCTGYAARDLWRDRTIIPVRGQTGWLVPQPDANYGVRYKNVSMLSKGDGVVVQNNNPDIGEMLGVGDSMELPDRSGIEEGLRIMAPALVLKGA
ncbi:FAD-dependent oxidoreductase [Novosphingobium flavum]|uniref:D-amino-acid oxidase n=2 Tax=Novosphingobium flavum TaxID=1778672 RepID=A0A7X1FUZ8_9SPHN|nr:FAD-dependent oxidoreductase [Novosphingobium flavum]